MIKVKRLNDKEFVVNSELILYIEATPDTVITLTNGHKIVVSDSVDEIVDKVIKYKARIHAFERRHDGNEV
ncbi:flagellar FlbD family protein [Tissierella carlieri]|jgi:flagellar protein FlbD|nr:flagellar FlbD family protein [Tissierella sp. P1]MBU5314232.1 flagellar FlbD family protein [Tissierella carlieri]MDU5079884.1 flagellar FlbD family protein [Bacillota bacterium]OZV12908.1 flagellar protein FlbD [Tissierella sp. P1]